MNLAKHTEYMDRAMQAGAMPAPYLVRKEVDRFGDLLQARLADRERLLQHYNAGKRDALREARWWMARNTAVLVAFGVCVGVTLAVVFAPAIAWWLL